MQKLFVFTFFISLLSLFFIIFETEESAFQFVQKIGRKRVGIIFFNLTIFSFLGFSLKEKNIKEPIIISERLVTNLAEADESNIINEDGFCVDINIAEKSDLLSIKHISDQRAEDLISLRPFKTLDDLVKIKGIGPARLNDIKIQGVACVK